MARIYLQAGDLAQAERQFAVVAGDAEVAQASKDMNAALVASARGEWEVGRGLLEGLVEGDRENFAVSFRCGAVSFDVDGVLKTFVVDRL